MEKIIIIDNSIVEEYNSYYFLQYPKRRVPPIKKAIPPSFNYFTSIKRMVQNSLKQKYKEFAIWLAKRYSIADLNINKAKFVYKFYFQDHRRRDFDNLLLTPKLLNDGFTEAKVIEDDNGEKLMIAFEPFDYDKKNPRVEITIIY